MTRFLQSLREDDFALYMQVWDELCGWLHVIDHTNYAQWLPVRVGDTVVLADTHPYIHEELVKSTGNFVGQKLTKIFSLGTKVKSHK